MVDCPDYPFSLKYCPGIGNRDAKTLTRRPYDPETAAEKWTQLTSEEIQALCQVVEPHVQRAARAEVVGVIAASFSRLFCDPHLSERWRSAYSLEERLRKGSSGRPFMQFDPESPGEEMLRALASELSKRIN